MYKKANQAFWPSMSEPALQRAAGHTHGYPTLSSKNSKVEKDNGEGAAHTHGDPEKANGRGRRHYGIGDKSLKVKKEVKLDGPVWLEGERQLVAVANIVLAPVSNPLDPAGCALQLHFSWKLL